MISFLSIVLYSALFHLLFAADTTNTTTNSTTVIVDTNTSSNVPEIPLWLNQSSTQLTKFLSDKYNYFMTPKGNKIWVCTMSLAWNELKRGLLQNKNPSFLNTTTISEKLTQNLNSELFTQKQLSTDSYFISSGYGQKAVERINRDVRQKFPNIIFLPLSYTLKDQDFISYAYLQKKLEFITAFSQQTNFTFKNASAQAFSAVNAKQRKQLYFKYYNNSQDFLMGIYSTNPNDQILLLKSNKTDIRNVTIQKLMNLIKLYETVPNSKLGKTDMFKMPVLQFDYTRNYNQMKQLSFSNPGYQQYKITQMFQKLVVNVDKTGVKAASQAVVIATRTIMPMNQKFFILNNNFWFILKQKNKKPYLIINVNSLKQSWTL